MSTTLEQPHVLTSLPLPVGGDSAWYACVAVGGNEEIATAVLYTSEEHVVLVAKSTTESVMFDINETVFRLFAPAGARLVAFERLPASSEIASDRLGELRGQHSQAEHPAMRIGVMNPISATNVRGSS
jgi:hypothetical protein